MGWKKGQKHSEETKHKISESVRKYHAEHPEVYDKISKGVNAWYSEHPEIRKMKSDCMLGNSNIRKQPGVSEKILKTINTPEYKLKESQRKKEYAKNHPEYRQKLSDAMNKRWEENYDEMLDNLLSRITGENCYSKRPDVRQKMSLSARKYYSENPLPRRIVRGKRSNVRMKDGTIVCLKSSYETRFAGILNALDIEWEYEKHKFHISSINSTYYTDFYLKDYDIHIETKGYINDYYKQKMIEFYYEYPDIDLIMIWGNNINNIEYEIGCYSPIDFHAFGIPIRDQVSIWNNDISGSNNYES